MKGPDGIPPPCAVPLSCLGGAETHVPGSGMCKACHDTVMSALADCHGPAPHDLTMMFSHRALKLAYERESGVLMASDAEMLAQGFCDWCQKGIWRASSSCMLAANPEAIFSAVHFWHTPWGSKIPHCSGACARQHAEANAIFAWDRLRNPNTLRAKSKWASSASEVADSKS